MAESGDWITPRLYGKPWFEKPPLLYWGGAFFFKILGEDHPETAARLPSAISALLATLALAWLAWRTYGEECARWLLLLLPSSVGMIGFSHAAATDMPFAGMLTIAMICAAVVLGLAHKPEDTPILPRTPWLALLLFGFFLGLAVLAKGPAGIILIGGAVFFWALFTKRWRDAFRLLHPAAIAAFCLTALPWYILCARRNPDFFRIFIIEHNFKRYLTPEFQHIQPFWFYGLVLLIAFVPWTTALVPAITVGSRRFREGKSSTSLFVLCWSVFCLVFFTISKSKLPGYILPAIPSLGFLLARGSHVATASQSRISRFSALAGVALFGLAAGAMSVIAAVTAHTSYSTSGLAFALCVIFLLFAITDGFLWYTTANSTPIRVCAALGMILPTLLAMLWLNKLTKYFFYRDPSGKTIARELSQRGISPGEITVHVMNRGMLLSLNFYARVEIPVWSTEAPKDGYLLLNGGNCNYVVQNTAICEPSPQYLESSEHYLFRVRLKTSLPGSDSGRQPH